MPAGFTVRCGVIFVGVADQQYRVIVSFVLTKLLRDPLSNGIRESKQAECDSICYWRGFLLLCGCCSVGGRHRGRELIVRWVHTWQMDCVA